MIHTHITSAGIPMIPINTKDKNIISTHTSNTDIQIIDETQGIIHPDTFTVPVKEYLVLLNDDQDITDKQSRPVTREIKPLVNFRQGQDPNERRPPSPIYANAILNGREKELEGMRIFNDAHKQPIPNLNTNSSINPSTKVPKYDTQIFTEHPFIWDGSYLGQFPSSIIVCERNVHDLKYFHLKLGSFYHFCIAKTTTSDYPCLFDELKPLFGLSKLGTHTIHIENKYYLLMRPSVKGIVCVYDHKLSDVLEYIDYTNPLNSSFINQMRRIFLFRDIVGLTVSNDSSIRLRYVGKGYVPMSFKETKTCILQERSILPITILEKWFNNMKITDVARQIMGIYESTDLSEYLFHFRNDVERIIKRVNRDLLWMSVYIVERLSDRIMPDSLLDESLWSMDYVVNEAGKHILKDQHM